jgi:hypothetical protein
MADKTETAAPEQTELPSVTVNDLVNVYNIIDLASKRGAFQANELSSVGAVANKVKSFVDHVQAAQKAAADEEGKEKADVTEDKEDKGEE